MRKWETVKQAMERTHLSRNSVMKFDRPGITTRIGKKILFDADALDEALMNGIQNNGK
jgi:hypothetical protein